MYQLFRRLSSHAVSEINHYVSACRPDEAVASDMVVTWCSHPDSQERSAILLLCSFLYIRITGKTIANFILHSPLLIVSKTQSMILLLSQAFWGCPAPYKKRHSLMHLTLRGVCRCGGYIPLGFNKGVPGVRRQLISVPHAGCNKTVWLYNWLTPYRRKPQHYGEEYTSDISLDAVNIWFTTDATQAILAQTETRFFFLW